MMSAASQTDIVSQRRRPSRWVVVARMRAPVPLVEPVPSPAMVAPVFLPPRGGVFWVGFLNLLCNESWRLKSKKSVNKFGVIGGAAGDGPEVVMSGREVEKIDTGPGRVEVVAPRGGTFCA